jgi:hypothetical protein
MFFYQLNELAPHLRPVQPEPEVGWRESIKAKPSRKFHGRLQLLFYDISLTFINYMGI